jgi:Uma2 family endonuclease
MATQVIEKPPRRRVFIPDEQRIVLRGIDWATYQRLAERVERQNIRLAYNRGVLELMCPGPLHDDYGRLICRMVWIVTLELGLPCRTQGATRWERPEAERGLEPDESFYFTPAKLAVIPHRSNKAADYPDPDLAIEVDLSPSQVDRPAIYAALNVPEVWRFDGEALRIDRLREDGTYEAVEESLFIPLSPAEIVHWLLLGEDATDQNEWARQFQEWVRATVLPRYRAAMEKQGRPLPGP